MVMDKRKRIFTYCSFICINFGLIPVYAGDFYTIIGPDGRPMIVQQKESKLDKKELLRTKKTEQAYSTVDQNNQVQVIKSKKNDEEKYPKSIVQKVETKTAPESENQSTLVLLKPENSELDVQADKRKIAVTSKIDSVKDARFDIDKVNLEANHSGTVTQESVKTSDHQPNKMTQQNKLDDQSQIRSEKVNPALASSQSIIQKSEMVRDDEHNSKITIIDGVEYVDNEYLEDREFNLEGKKRFYIMPDNSVGGSRRFETVEREKGITKSILSKFTNSSPSKNVPVVLASTYYRLPKNEVVQSLEQTCFQGKKLNKAKLLSLDKNEMGVWPVPPIKERFVYDVIQLDKPVENIHFTSYASSQKSPTYYWPLIVFLDQQGCVIEGVSGFKNENINSTSTSYSALEGVLKKPPNAVYLFMTPLSEAVDAQNVQLTNKGQIKLSVLR